MKKYSLATVASLTFFAGIASAQTLPSETTTSTTTTVPAVPASPPAGTATSQKFQETIDANGVQTDKSQKVVSGPDGTRVISTTRTSAPDGTQLGVSHVEQTVAPTGTTTTYSKTTTTTTDH